MKLKHPFNNEPMAVSSFVEFHLKGQERGALETVQVQADNISVAFSRLVELLAERGQLSKEEVYRIVGAYIPEKL